MPLLDDLKSDLERDEGVILHAYTDSLGIVTLGCGRNIDQSAGGGISHDEAMLLLANDIHRVFSELDGEFPWWREMTENRQRALANMLFNLGLTRLKGFHRMLASMEMGNYEAAAREALASKWAKQVGPRSDRIAALIREG